MSPRMVEGWLAALTDGTDSNFEDGFMSDSIRFGRCVSSHRLKLSRISLAVVGGLAILGSTASAQEGAPFDDLKRLVDVQQQQIREMHDQIARLQQNAPTPPIPPSAINSPRDGSVPAVPADFTPDAAAKPGAAAAPAKQPDDGYVVGSDLSVKTDFRKGLFLWFATPNNDFNMHIGGWAQWDNVWFDQSPSLKAAPIARTPANTVGFAGGVAGGGIGDLQDGEFFRRIRTFFEGSFWENGEYRLIAASLRDAKSESRRDSNSCVGQAVA